uniref:Uncharacterized protein n=1 Tax=Heterorhabditis bacteriophora TaxID=37862 RepID=A0A1I7XNB1_HETBA
MNKVSNAQFLAASGVHTVL